MSRLASLFLYLIHALYALTSLTLSLREYFVREPKSVAAERRQVPKHIAILLASDHDHHDANSEAFEQQILQNVEKVVAWCQVAGIQRLTLYDRQGILSRLSFEIRSRLKDVVGSADPCTSESELEYPLTPPLSDDSTSRSRSLSPQKSLSLKLHVNTVKLGEQPRRRRNSGRGVVKRRVSRKGSESDTTAIAVHITSRDSGKPGLAQVADALAADIRRTSTSAKPQDFTLSIDELKSLVEGDNGFPSPDLMLVHCMTRRRSPKNVLELHGFPPWQISLTEFHYILYPNTWWSWGMFRPTPTYIPLTELDFCHALDQYASAEMRHGK